MTSESKTSTRSHLSYYRQLAPTAAVRVSPLCLGAMTFGRAHSERYGEVSHETAFQILDTFYDNGGNFVDTANVYRAGESELWLGEWMKKRGNRDGIVLATKYTSIDEQRAKGQIPVNFISNNIFQHRVPPSRATGSLGDTKLAARPLFVAVHG